MDASTLGRSLVPVTARVEPGRLRFFLNAVGEANPAFRGAGAPLPPAYLFCLGMLDAEQPLGRLTELDIDMARPLHGEQPFTYHAAVAEGDVLTFQSRVADVADKKNGAMTLVVVETTVSNQHGTHVADLSRTLSVLNGAAA